MLTGNRRLVAGGTVVALVWAIAVAATTGRAAASVVKPFVKSYDQVIYGDFIEVGNGNLRCPTSADGVPFPAGKTPATCAAGQTAAGPADGNNNYYMVQGDVDGDPGTFNSSQASLVIPPGATVDFARLNWGGDTGRFKLPNGTFSTIPSCTQAGQATPSVPPPGSAATQKPRLTVGAGASSDITPIAETEDPISVIGANQEQYYSAYADVTPNFSAAPTGGPLTVTVGNVWSPTGLNCYAGWSLVVVYKYPQLTPTYAPSKKEVFVYDGHIRQGASDSPTTTTVADFRAATNTTKIGVTAYEGDRQITGDQLQVNGSPVTDGSTNAPTNFFVSHADGASNPSTIYNYSVDANGFTTTNIPIGATSASVSFVTSGDGYVAQNFVMSLAVPELLITKSVEPAVAHAGDPVTYTITVTNPSTASAQGVAVSDPLLPACDRTIGVLGSKGTSTYTCAGVAPANDQTNVATVTGKSDLGDDLSGTAVATLRVIHPAIAITKTADKPGYRVGDPVNYTITVTNAGDVPLSDIVVADPSTPSCAKKLDTLAVAGTTTYTCSDTAPVPGNANSVSVSATDPLALTVTSTASTPVPLIHPGIAITKVASPSTVRAGESTTFTISVTNTGDSPLTQVAVSDPVTPACTTTVPGTLAAHATYTYTCTAAPPASVTNTATVSATDLSGQTVSAKDSAPVTVINPALTLTKTADRAEYRTGDPVTFTLTVTNSGDVTLTDVAVTDPAFPQCARSFAALTVGHVQTWTCTVTAPSSDFTNVASASANDPSGRPVTSTASVPVAVIHPALDITKTAHPLTVRVGDSVTYTVTVRNTGDVAITGVTVKDPTTPACDRTIGTLARGAAPVTYTCSISAGASSPLLNTATVTGTPPAGPAVTDTATATVTVIHPSIALVKTASPKIVRPGQPITYSITVTNTGDVDLSDVTVADPTLPGCDRSFATIAASDQRVYSCAMTAGDTSSTNTANVNATPPVGPVVSDTSSAGVTVIHPALTVHKHATVTQVRPGDPITYLITATNTGDVALSDVLINDPAVPGCSVTLATLAVGDTSTALSCQTIAPAADVTNTATATATAPDGAAVSAAGSTTVPVIHPAIAITKLADQTQVRPGDSAGFKITVSNVGDVVLDPVAVSDPSAPDCARAIAAPLAPGATVTYHCALIVGQDDFVNVATVSGVDPTARPVTATAEAPVDVIHPAITLMKAVAPSNAQPGQPITYTLTVTNSGDVTLSNAVVSDPLVPGCDTVIAVLTQGATVRYTCETTAPTTNFTNTASVSASAPIGAPVTSTASAQLRVDHPHLTVTKTADVTSARPGDPITFTITVTNDGDVALQTVVVDPSFAQCANNIGAMPVAPAPGSTVSYTCTAAAPQSSLINTAVARGTPPSGPGVTDTAHVAVTVIHPGLKIVKGGPTGPVRVGQPVTFTITVSNVGDVDLTGVTVTDAIAPGCDATIGILAAGHSAPAYTCTMTAAKDDYTNSASASGVDPLGHTLTATDTADVDVIHPALTLLKSVQPTLARTGDPVVYTFTITNTGDVDLADVALADPTLPACDQKLPGPLAVGHIETLTCESAAPPNTVTNTATATATAPVGDPVQATSSVTLTVVHPAVSITKTAPTAPVHPNDTVTFTITVHNTGDVPLSDATVVDPFSPACANRLGPLSVGQIKTYECTVIALGADFSNTASVSARPAIGAPVTDQSTAHVSVIHPALTVRKTGPGHPVVAGHIATFTITVTNSGDVALSDVIVSDPSTAACNHTIGALAVGQAATYTCALKAPAASFTNRVNATGTDPAGGSAISTATAALTVVHPSMVLRKTASSAPVAPGATVIYTLTVTNTGDVALHDVQVVDANTPACNRAISALAAGAIVTYTCRGVAASHSFLNVATATGTATACNGSGCTPIPDSTVTARGQAAVTVVAPVSPVVPIAPAGAGTPPATLPFTGVAALSQLLFGLLTTACGAALIALSRRRRRS